MAVTTNNLNSTPVSTKNIPPLTNSGFISGGSTSGSGSGSASGFNSNSGFSNHGSRSSSFANTTVSGGSSGSSYKDRSGSSSDRVSDSQRTSPPVNDNNSSNGRGRSHNNSAANSSGFPSGRRRKRKQSGHYFKNPLNYSGASSPNSGNQNRRRRRRTSPEFPDAHDRDRRTIIAHQLAARITKKQLRDFFDFHGCNVVDCSIVKDRATNRSRGIAFVEFKHYSDVQRALSLTGEKLVGIPILIDITDTEKERQAANANVNSAEVLQQQGDHPVKVANLAYNLNEAAVRLAFQKFGKINSIILFKNFEGKPTGRAIINFADLAAAHVAKKSMDGALLADRYVRVYDDGARGIPKNRKSKKRFNNSSKRDATSLSSESSNGMSYNKQKSDSGSDDLSNGSSSFGEYNTADGVSRSDLMKRLAGAELAHSNRRHLTPSVDSCDSSSLRSR